MKKMLFLTVAFLAFSVIYCSGQRKSKRELRIENQYLKEQIEDLQGKMLDLEKNIRTFVRLSQEGDSIRNSIIKSLEDSALPKNYDGLIFKPSSGEWFSENGVSNKYQILFESGTYLERSKDKIGSSCCGLFINYRNIKIFSEGELIYQISLREDGKGISIMDIPKRGDSFLFGSLEEFSCEFQSFLEKNFEIKMPTVVVN